MFSAVFKLRWNQGIEINDTASHICQKVAFSIKEYALYKDVLLAYKQHLKSTKCAAVRYCSKTYHKRTFWLKFLSVLSFAPLICRVFWSEDLQVGDLFGATNQTP